MYGLVLSIHIIACIFLVIAVLLQAGKGADIGAVFGGAGSQALFGSVGPADFLNKATRVLVVVFMITSLTLGYFAFERPSESIMEKQTVSAPQTPDTQAPVPAAEPQPAPTETPASPQ